MRVIPWLALARSTVSLGRRTICGLRGHEMVLHREPARLSLRCLACGAETAGWTIDVRPAFRCQAPARAQRHGPATGAAQRTLVPLIKESVALARRAAG